MRLAVLERLPLAAAALSPTLAFLFSHSTPSELSRILFWTVLCSLPLILAPGSRGIRVSSSIQLLLLPLTICWVASVTTIGTGPSPTLIDTGLSAPWNEVKSTIQLFYSSFTFWLITAFVVTAHLWTLRMSPSSINTHPIMETAFVLSMFPLVFANLDGLPEARSVVDLCPPAVRRAVPTLFSIGVAKTSLSRALNGSDTKQEPPLDARRVPKPFTARTGVYLFVLGESLRADAVIDERRGEWSRALQKRIDSGLGLRLNDACAGGNRTAISVPLLLRAMAPQPPSDLSGVPSILALAKAAGAKTAYISNHVDLFLHESGHDEIQVPAGFDSLAYDGVTVGMVKDFVERAATGSKAILVHLYGQHLRYQDRYPADFVKTTTSPVGVDAEAIEYQNAAEYGAKVLVEYGALLDEIKEPAVLAFTSDHGEYLSSDHTKRKYHAWPTIGPLEARVPALLLWNKAFDADGMIQDLRPHTPDGPLIAHRNVAEIWLHALGKLNPPLILDYAPSTWGTTVEGAGERVVACKNLHE